MTTPEIQYTIDSLPHDLVKACENFHIKCLLHMAKGSYAGKKGWDSEAIDVEAVKKDLDRALREGDWTSVSNYAMILNHHKVAGKVGREEYNRLVNGSQAKLFDF